MINVIEDIAKIMKYDKSHNIKVVVEPNGITISLSEGSFNDVFDIPIKYDCSDGIYIDNEKQKEQLVFATLILLKILWNILKII